MSEESPLTTCFPDANAIFAASHKPIGDSKTDCLVALDTNVLLAPYGLSEHPLTQIADTYDRLAREGRLVIPAQVTREFARNRNAKIGELLKTVHDQMSRQSSPMGTKYAFLRNLPDYEKSLKISEQIEDKQKELLASLRKVADTIRGWSTTDPVWDVYRRVLPGTIVELASETRNAIVKEGKFRSDNHIPPGYKDASKPDGGIGDLIIWKTLLQVGRERNKDLVFVTMDQKTDWWTHSNGGALFPRYELVEEYRAATGQNVHLLRFSEFLAEFGLEETVVEAVQDVEDESESEMPRNASDSVQRALHEHLVLKDYRSLQETMKRTQQRIVGKNHARKRYLERGDEDKVSRANEDMFALLNEKAALEASMNVFRQRFPFLLRYDDGMLNFSDLEGSDE
ncbi:PIN domain-containing protein [Candidatus Filomicrobium marinum]|uniref:PIN domain-containing protein n=1 Tax=Candidatus Filomicrobium marinum TaxID=1608628 RepID=UPI00126027BE|nr:PIN domain-containing protein [Candidatus Filomicrobium marinum]